MAWIMYLGLFLGFVGCAMICIGIAIWYISPSNRQVAQTLMGNGAAVTGWGMAISMGGAMIINIFSR